MPITVISRTADISEDGRFRHRLTRTWLDADRITSDAFDLWVMLNPSTADGDVDDPTVRRCMSFSARDGSVHGIQILNLFSYRSTDPSVLLKRHASGFVNNHPDSSMYWVDAISNPNRRRVIAAWGSTPRPASHAIMNLRRYALDLVCLGTNRDGSPKHPVRLANATPFRPYTLTEEV